MLKILKGTFADALSFVTGYGDGTGYGYVFGDGNGRGVGYVSGAGQGSDVDNGFKHTKEREKMSERIPVLITTDKDKRGVFFGYIDPEDASKEELKAYDVQMCVYWSRGVKGVLGLAANGPDKECRITAPVKNGIIKGVTFVAECSDAAVKAWKKQPWSN